VKKNYKDVDPKLLEFCETVRETVRFQALIDHGTAYRAGMELGIDGKRLRELVDKLTQRAALRGYSPAHDMTHPTPATHIVKGVSTLYDGDGVIKSQWVKTNVAQQDLLESFTEACKVLAEPYKGLAKPVPRPKIADKDMMTCYCLGDPHIGLYAYGKENGGANFDCEIAERNLCGAMVDLVDRSPASGVAVILNLGDFYHADNQSQLTNSGHKLDVDGRWSRVMDTGIQLMRTCIDYSLRKHSRVVVQNNIGNHDNLTSQMLAKVLQAYYCKDKRVTIEPSISKFWYYQHGRVLLGSTHGDYAKPAQMPLIMAHDVPEMWGATLHRHIHMGHIHSKTHHDFPGCTVESHRTLAAGDSWSHSSGYRSIRDMTAIYYHKDAGELDRSRSWVKQ